MQSILHTFNRWLCAMGLDFKGMFYLFRLGIRSTPGFIREYRLIKKQNTNAQFSESLHMNFPCFIERFQTAGIPNDTYFYQDLLVARRIFTRAPKKHVDVASRIDGFVAHVASFRVIEVFDIRPLTSQDSNIVFRQCDLMKPDHGLSEYTDSLSCLHALEHFGLGRYGDPINIDGYKDGFESLTNLLQPGGVLYLSVPIGKQRIDFNAHRVFAVDTILSLAKGRYELMDFSCIDPSGNLRESMSVRDEQPASWGSEVYGLGIFELRKI